MTRPAPLAADEPNLGLALRSADGVPWSPGEGLLDDLARRSAAHADAAFQSALREFCDALGIRVPRDMKRAQRAFVSLGLIGRGDG